MILYKLKEWLEPSFPYRAPVTYAGASSFGDVMKLISCARCGRIHPWGQCPVPKPVRRSGEKTAIQKWRSSAQWQHKAAQILERDAHLCKMCLADGTITSTGLSVHHIIPIAQAEDRRLEDGNLITLCRRHHDMVEGDERYVAVLHRLASIPPGKLLRNGPGTVDRTAPLKKQTFP